MTHTQTQGADGAGTKTAEFKPGDLVLNARYAHRDAYPALGESAYVQAVDGDYLDFGHGRKLLYSLFDPVIPALASPRADSAERAAGADLDWAVSRWRAEVENRPLHNFHRRSLDTTWRQVISRFGGDPDALVGPSHDALASATPISHNAPEGDE